MVKTLIISASSDIGFEFAKERFISGETVFGTYRSRSNLEKINQYCNQAFYLDINQEQSIVNFITKIAKSDFLWDKLLFCPCQPYPYKSFFNGTFEEWENSFNLNSIQQLKILHKLFNYRSKKSRVLFFAGGGSNSATLNFSAYTSAKIHLTKMVELLDFENSDISFSILGPGWVKTKNHEFALKYSDKNSEKYKSTKKFMSNPIGATPMTEVINSINWIFNQEKNIVGGRNFSTAYDPWGDNHPQNEELLKLLMDDSNLYKLRRFGNQFFTQKRYDK